MKKSLAILLTAALIAALPLAAAASVHGNSGGHGGHGSSPGDSHGSTHGSHDNRSAATAGGHHEMLMVGEQSVTGVNGMAHLNEVGEAMAKMGMKETHHFSILFTSEAGGAIIEEGSAAVRVIGPDGRESAPVRLVAMDGHFGADLVLANRGEHIFVIGTRLLDGQTRQFRFTHQLD